MKYLVTIFDINSIQSLSLYADGFVVGNAQFSSRLTRSFDVEEMNNLAVELKKINKELFINFNQMMDDGKLKQIQSFIDKLDLHLITGFIVADIGVFMTLKNLGIDHIIYHPETLLTNVYDFNFMNNFGGKGAFVAKEITLEDVKIIAQGKAYALFFNGHGYLNMFYSRRKLLDHYQSFLGEDHDLNNRQDLRLIEEKRSDDPYPVLQDDGGTHVFRSKIFSAIKDLDVLKDFVDYFLVDTIFESDAYALDVLKMYINADESMLSYLEETYHQKIDDAFLHTKTAYKVKK